VVVCVLTDSASVVVHIINGEQPAAMQHEHSSGAVGISRYKFNTLNINIGGIARTVMTWCGESTWIGLIVVAGWSVLR
jgi:hypothetical protein